MWGWGVFGNESISLGVNEQHFAKIIQAISRLVSGTFHHTGAGVSISVLGFKL